MYQTKLLRIRSLTMAYCRSNDYLIMVNNADKLSTTNAISYLQPEKVYISP